MESDGKRDRYYELDFFRFFAAFSVVLYHYTFYRYATKTLPIVEYPVLGAVFKYGYLGVDLFFMISGFVILLTALNKDLKGFIVSRVIRIYPAFWVSVTLTALVVLLLDDGASKLKLITYFANLPLIFGYFGIQLVDGVYWTLLLELNFYLLIGLMVFFKVEHKAIHFIFLWMVISIIHPYVGLPAFWVNFLILKWSSYFIAGAIFFLVRRDGVTIYTTIILMGAYYLSIRHAYWRIPYLEKYFLADFSAVTVIGIITFFYGSFFALALDWLRKINKPSMLFWGGTNLSFIFNTL